MISSISNTRVKQLVIWQSKAKERKKAGIFMVEGLKMFEEAPAAWITEIYISQELMQKIKAASSGISLSIKQKIQKLGYEEVSEEVLRRISDTQTPQGILCVLKRPSYTLADILSKEAPLLVILEDLQDPGNLGTIIRTAEGAGVHGIILSKDTVDIYNPKTIRATMGSIYRMPFIYAESLIDTIKQLRQREITTYAAHLDGRAYYDSFHFKQGSAFLIGNEGAGLKQETAKAADTYLKIPMEGEVESLNAAIAASLLVYEAHRQRSVE